MIRGTWRGGLLGGITPSERDLAPSAGSCGYDKRGHHLRHIFHQNILKNGIIFQPVGGCAL